MTDHPKSETAISRPDIGRREQYWLAAAVVLMAGGVAWTGYVAGGVPVLFAMLLPVAGFGVAALLLVWRQTAMASKAILDTRLLFYVLDSQPDAILIEGGPGEAIFANRAFRAMTVRLAPPSGKGRSTGGPPWRWLESAGAPAGLVDRLRAACDRRRPAHGIVDLQAGEHGGRYEVSVRQLGEATWAWRIHRLAGGWAAVAPGWSARAEAHAEASAAGLYTLDEAGRFLYLNPVIAEWLGRPTGEILDSDGTLQAHLVDEPGLDPLRPGLNLFALKGVDGLEREIQTTQAIVRAGGRTLIHGIARPVGPAGAAAQRFQELFREMPVGVALVDRRFRIGDCNAAFVSLVDDPAPAGKPVLDFIVDEEKVALLPELQAVLDGRSPAKSLEVSFKGEGQAVASIFVGRLQDDHGNATGLVLLVVDTTERKNLEAQLVQSQKMQAVGQLAGGIAHDFNNVLTAMIGFCDLLLQRHRPGDQSFADIMQIKQNANRAAALVRQLLAFSRQQTLQPRLLNVTEVLAELSNLLRRLLGEKIELNMVHGRDLGLVKGDQGQLEQVIINLAVNARDAMSGGGLLTVRTGNAEVDRARQAHGEVMPVGAYVHISVRDTGTGIPKENFARIFEPFFTTKEVGSGTGLGLSTVYGIVKQTGGYLFVDSPGEGQGTVFDIYFPRQEAGVVEPASTDSAEIAADLTGGGTVLLVEDEDPVRLFSARALRNKGYKVVEAKTGEAALELLNGGAFDLLVTDMVMPRVDGAQVIRAARGKMPDLPVICISGYTEESVLNEVESLDNLRFLSKPFSLKQLAAAVKEQLARAEQRRDRADA